MRRLTASLSLLALAGCALQPSRAGVRLPALHLAPAALEQELFLQQRLHFMRNGQERELDALLEVDADSLRLAVQALGRAAVLLTWDGQRLEEERADWLPPFVRGGRVLDDLQFALWPSAAIQAALPGDWTLREADGLRELCRGDRPWLSAERLPDGTILLVNHANGYRLTIESVAVGGRP